MAKSFHSEFKVISLTYHNFSYQCNYIKPFLMLAIKKRHLLQLFRTEIDGLCQLVKRVVQKEFSEKKKEGPKRERERREDKRHGGGHLE